MRAGATDVPKLLESAVSSAMQTPHALNKIIECLARLARIDWEGNQTFRCRFRHRELTFPETPISERGSVVQRRVVRAHFDAALMEHRVDEVVLRPAELREVELDWIKVKDMFVTGPHDRKCDSRHVAQSCGKVSGIVNATLVERIQLAQLNDAHGALDIRHA